MVVSIQHFAAINQVFKKHPMSLQTFATIFVRRLSKDEPREGSNLFHQKLLRSEIMKDVLPWFHKSYFRTLHKKRNSPYSLRLPSGVMFQFPEIEFHFFRPVFQPNQQRTPGHLLTLLAMTGKNCFWGCNAAKTMSTAGASSFPCNLWTMRIDGIFRH